MREIQALNSELSAVGLCIFYSPLQVCCWSGKEWEELDVSQAEKEYRELRLKHHPSGPFR